MSIAFSSTNDKSLDEKFIKIFKKTLCLYHTSSFYIFLLHCNISFLVFIVKDFFSFEIGLVVWTPILSRRNIKHFMFSKEII